MRDEPSGHPRHRRRKSGSKIQLRSSEKGRRLAIEMTRAYRARQLSHRKPPDSLAKFPANWPGYTATRSPRITRRYDRSSRRSIRGRRSPLRLGNSKTTHTRLSMRRREAMAIGRLQGALRKVFARSRSEDGLEKRHYDHERISRVFGRTHPRIFANGEASVRHDVEQISSLRHRSWFCVRCASVEWKRKSVRKGASPVHFSRSERLLRSSDRQHHKPQRGRLRKQV